MIWLDKSKNVSKGLWQGDVEMAEPVQNKYSLDWLERLHRIVSQDKTRLEAYAQEQTYLPVTTFRNYVAGIFEQLKKNKEMLWFDLARALKEELKEDFDYYKLWEVITNLAYLSYIEIGERKTDGNCLLRLIEAK
jgi:hypothetical protein